jgi:cysteine desulfurase/selenocysteine lyase
MDSAATSQALYTVIEDQHEFNLRHRANAHRSGHSMGAWVDGIYHEAKHTIAVWLGLDHKTADNIIFTSGATQALDDAVRMIGCVYKRATIFIGKDFHHSLFLPFHQLAADNSFFNIEFIDVDINGKLDLVQLTEKMKSVEGPKIIAATAVSNVLGMVNDLVAIKKLAKLHKAVTVIDASQIVGKRTVNLNGFDFVAFSWHKIYGPTGLGTLIVNNRWMEAEPVRPGGGTVTKVTLNSANWVTSAAKFEPGTQNLSAIASIPRLVNWLIQYRDDLEEHDKAISELVKSHITVNQFRPVALSETGLISLVPVLASPEDYAYMLDAKNIMVRTGKLCAEPLVSLYNVNGLIRLSWAAYTTSTDVEKTFDVLGEAYARLQKHV